MTTLAAIAARARFDAVCFDFDSTLSRLEGIDELAVLRNAADQIVPLTAAAMEGTLPLDQVYGRRLDIVRPDAEALAWLAQRYIDEMVPGVPATLQALRDAGTAVYIVSGGLRGAILPMAARLGIADECVFAVEVVLGPDGEYADFDRAAPLARPDGKAAVCRTLRARHERLALVGDGVTDIAAREAGAYVVGFGGVARREAVVAGANVFVDGPDLTAVLPALLA